MPVTVASPASDIAVAVMTVEAGNSLPEMVSRGILNVSVALSSPSGNALNEDPPQLPDFRKMLPLSQS